MRVQRQRSRHPATQGVAHDKIQRGNIGQFISHHLALDNAGEMRLHARGGHLFQQQRIVFRIVGNDRDIGRIALVSGAGMGDLAQLHRFYVPTNRTCGFASSRGNSTEATATTSRADFHAPPPPAGPLV